MKKCPECGQEKNEMAFILNEICYSCVYLRKLKISKSKQKFLRPDCKVCQKKVPEGKISYCSEECYKIGTQRVKNEYIKKNCALNVENLHWKRRDFTW